MAVMVIIVAFVAIVAFSTKTTDISTPNISNATATQAVTTTPRTTPAPRVTATPKATIAPQKTVKAKTNWTDGYGKTYFINQEVAEDCTLQARLDRAIMKTYNVYDVVRDDDVIVCTSTDGVWVPEQVKLLRDGNAILAWADGHSVSYGRVSSAATDVRFVSQFYCDKHMAIRKDGTLAKVYPNGEELMGSFTNGDYLDAWVLVERRHNGQSVYTWCLNVCDCSKVAGGAQSPSGGNEPATTKKPTEPSREPENNPRATVRPSPSTSTTVGENNERPTATTKVEARPTFSTNTVEEPRPTISTEDWYDQPIEVETEY